MLPLTLYEIENRREEIILYIKSEASCQVPTSTNRAPSESKCNILSQGSLAGSSLPFMASLSIKVSKP
jgi:hypothetical protein